MGSRQCHSTLLGVYLPVFEDALENALERLDGLRHLAVRDLEDLEHSDAIVRLESGTHKLMEVHHVVGAVLRVLRGVQGVQRIMNALRVNRE